MADRRGHTFSRDTAVAGLVLGFLAALAACSELEPTHWPIPSSPAQGGSSGTEQGGSMSSAGGGTSGSGGSAVETTGGAGGTPVPEPPPPNACGDELPATFIVTCGACHTAQGQPHPRYPDLYEYDGTLDELRQRVREGSEAGMPAYAAELISDAELSAIFEYFTGGNARGHGRELGAVEPLFEPADAVNPPVVFERADGTLVTRGAGRVRGRHEGPLDTNQPFMEFVEDYFVSRTYGWIVEDFTRLGESRVRVTYLPIAMPTPGTNFRAWKDYGNGDVFLMNMGMTSEAPLPELPYAGENLADSYPSRIAPYALVQQQETTRNSRAGRDLESDDLLEFEFGIFQEPGVIEPPGSRTSYYSDTFRYRVGRGGVTADNPDPYTDGKGVLGPVEAAQQGGATTNVWAYFMPETQFGQMALNIQHENVQHFVEGRRLFHTDFETGEHGESGNAPFTEQSGKAGPLGTTTSCESCHEHNGPGETLTGPLGPTSSMVIKLYGESSRQLQPADGSAAPGGSEEKTVELADGTSIVLRRPKIEASLSGGRVPAYSARIARKLIGLGLLEAIDEQTLLTRADMSDCDDDGISGRPSYVEDPSTGALRVGRFGWKAEKVSIEHQVAEALHDDMGVGSRVFPDGAEAELSDDDLARLVTYMRLIAVPGQRDHEAERVRAGEQIFQTIGCARCHQSDTVTGENHPFAELRAQGIKPYTDLLLHDLGPDLADDSQRPDPVSASDPPSASEWRTPPLWGTGLLAAVNGRTGLLHDGRAANVLEAILWHGGEAEATRERVKRLAAAEREALVEFVLSL
ncbi:MAG TPA: di-heme oxidoredictase family protein [Polyangiaceae bacterium]